MNDSDQLRQRSATGLSSVVKIALIVGSAVCAGMLVFLVLLRDDLRNGRNVVIALATVVVVAGIVWGALAVTRWQARTASPLLGADKPTREAVARALRTGTTSDPRIDALARDAARISGGQWWIVVAGCFLAVVEAAALVIRVADGEWLSAVFAGMISIAVGGVAAGKWVELRRYRAYLRQPGPARAPGTAA